MSNTILCFAEVVENTDDVNNFFVKYHVSVSDERYITYKNYISPSGLGLASDPLIQQFDTKRDYVYLSLKKAVFLNTEDMVAFKLKFPEAIFNKQEYH